MLRNLSINFIHSVSIYRPLCFSRLQYSIHKMSGPLQEEKKKPQEEPEKVMLNDMCFSKVSEGEASILFPSSQGVFYNPVQEFNRDISIAVIRSFASEYVRKDKMKKKRRKLESTSDSNHPNGSPITVDTKSSVDSESNATDPQFRECNVRYEDGLRILEALGASGLRSIRYAKEIPGIKEIICNDLSSVAVECMKRNIDYNGVNHLVTASNNDASLLLYMNRGGFNSTGETFDVVDLDPYGSPHPFLDGAVQAVSDGGLLLITCTDMGVLCGNSPESCYAKYGATSVKTKSCHEFALRIALQCVESHANRYGRYIEPLMSMSADFYIRIAMRVHFSQARVKESYTKVGHVHHCVGCDTMTPTPIGQIVTEGPSVKHKLSHVKGGERCAHCNSRQQLTGPIWLAPIHCTDFLSKLLKEVNGEVTGERKPLGTARRINGMVSMMYEELPDTPLYTVHDKLCAVLGIMPSKMDRTASAILNAGYRFSMSHCKMNSIKTDAPTSVLWDIMRAHESEGKPSKWRKVATSPGNVILTSTPGIEVDFSPHPKAVPESRQKELLRFQHNPERNWGPLTRSTTKVLENGQKKKQFKNQGRKSRNKNKKENRDENDGKEEHSKYSDDEQKNKKAKMELEECK